jgi:sugar (glycoside-pentoside-hexuronide) transporter
MLEKPCRKHNKGDIMSDVTSAVSQIKEKRLSVPTKVIFGLGDWLNTMTYGMMGAFLMYFYTDIIVIPMGVVTTIMALSKLWDAANDPVIGVIIDKSRSRWGVYRPWLLFGSIPFAVIAILVFFPTGNWTSTGKIVWFSTLYAIYMVVFTIYHISYGALGGAMTQNPDDRGSLFGYRLGSSSAMYWILSSTFILLTGFLTRKFGMTTQVSYFTAAAVYSLPGIAFAVIIFFKCKEVVKPPESNKMPFKDMVRVVATNPPLVMTMLGQFVCGIYQTGRGTVMIYYFTYFVKNMGLFSIYNAIALSVGILGPFTAPFISEKIGNKGRTVSLGAGVCGVCFILMFFINPSTNLVLFIALASIAGFFQGLISASVYACMLDTIELSQLNTGLRAGAFIVSLCHFSNKLGMTIITAGSGAILAVLGYVANADQNPNVLMAINVIFTLAAGIIGLGLAVMFLFYKLDRNTYYGILEKLKLKEAQGESA